MKLSIRWQLLLAVICVSFIFSILSFRVQTVGQCTTRVPASGGVLVEGVVGLPQRLNPLLADSNRVDEALSSLIFDGLVRYDAAGRLQPALARSWEVGEDGRRFTFELRDDVSWHDGQPFTAADVAFTYGLLQTEDFPDVSGLRQLWQQVEIEVLSDSIIQFTLPVAYIPFLDATTVGVLPAHILEQVPPAEIAAHPFNRSPVGTGPFLAVPGSDWQQSGVLRLAANPVYWWQGVKIETIEFRFYPDHEALVAAYNQGEIQAISDVGPAALPEVISLDGLRLFTAPAPRYTQLLFNLDGQSAAAPLQSVEVRQALAQALDRELLLDQALNGQGLPLEGPYLPASWAYDQALLTRYRPNPAAAAAALEAAGWLLPEEGAWRQNEEGETLSLRFLRADSAEYQSLAEGISRQWAAVGVQVIEEIVPVTELRAALEAGEFDVAIIEVEPPGDPDLYDFWSQEAIVRGQNYGSWNNRRASEALEAARQLPTVDEREPYYEAFLRFYDSDLPALTLYQHVYTYGLSERVLQADIGRIDRPRERYQTLAEWFLNYEEVAVDCSEIEATAQP